MQEIEMQGIICIIAAAVNCKQWKKQGTEGVQYDRAEKYGGADESN